MFRKRIIDKVFCISMQRTGTTSVGDFFRNFGYHCAGWEVSKKNNWTKYAFDGNYEAIFRSKDFINNRVFEDGPWGTGDFYKFLFYRFPDSKFVLFTRDPDSWFDSMVKHSGGKTLGNTFRHCYYYARESEYFDLMEESFDYNSNEKDNLLLLNETHREHYKEIYINRNRHALNFLKSSDAACNRHIHLMLEQKDKWELLGEYFGIDIPEGFNVHSNKSKR